MSDDTYNGWKNYETWAVGMFPCGYGDDDATELHPLVSDMFGAALSSVDWYELADAWIENVREQVA
jgi:hypothetical protein